MKKRNKKREELDKKEGKKHSKEIKKMWSEIRGKEKGEGGEGQRDNLRGIILRKKEKFLGYFGYHYW